MYYWKFYIRSVKVINLQKSIKSNPNFREYKSNLHNIYLLVTLPSFIWTYNQYSSPIYLMNKKKLWYFHYSAVWPCSHKSKRLVNTYNITSKVSLNWEKSLDMYYNTLRITILGRRSKIHKQMTSTNNNQNPMSVCEKI